jgi:hypothetical protein
MIRWALAFTTIDGKLIVQVLMAPKPDRLLLGETSLVSPEIELSTTVKGKKFKRLSDILKGGHESADLWIV